MKYLFFLMFICTSCGPETFMFKHTFILKNNIETPIKIKVFFLDELQKEVTLEPDEKYKGEELETTVNLRKNLNGKSPSTSLGGEFIEIIYNNERISTYFFTEIDDGLGNFSAPVLRNILRTSNYESIGNDEYLFTITQQDFDNATPCDGPCE